MKGGPLLLCIPNLATSEKATIARLEDAAAGVHLLDVHTDVDHDRTVMTIAGNPSLLREAIVAMAEVALQEIDIASRTGVHPRTGALDVVPFVPVAGTSMSEAIAAAHGTGADLNSKGISVTFYGEASNPSRQLPEARRSVSEEGHSDLEGSIRSAGVTMIGARRSLVAFNVNLATEDPVHCRRIARAVRGRDIRALGFSLRSKRLTQVSMNLIDPNVTTMPMAFDAVVLEARRSGIDVAGSELVGLATTGSMGGRNHASFGLATPPKVVEVLIAGLK